MPPEEKRFDVFGVHDYLVQRINGINIFFLGLVQLELKQTNLIITITIIRLFLNSLYLMIGHNPNRLRHLDKGTFT